MQPNVRARGRSVLGLLRPHAAADERGMTEALGGRGIPGRRVPRAVPSVYDQEPPAAVGLPGPALPALPAGPVCCWANRCSWSAETRRDEGNARARRGRLHRSRLQRGLQHRPRTGRALRDGDPAQAGARSSTTSTRTTRCPWSASSPPATRLELVRNTLGQGVINAIRAGVEAARLGRGHRLHGGSVGRPQGGAPTWSELIRDEGYDIVCASRYMRGGRQIGGPILKRTMSRVAGVSLYWLAGLPTHDATNAFRAYRLIRASRDSRSRAQGGFEYSLEVTAKATSAGRRVTEVPSTWRDRTAGQSRFADEMAAAVPQVVRLRAHSPTAPDRGRTCMTWPRTFDRDR